MRALSKLINENEPELVLFVGEALVGNDGVNQLQMFNQVRRMERSKYANIYTYTSHAYMFDGLMHSVVTLRALWLASELPLIETGKATFQLIIGSTCSEELKISIKRSSRL